MVHDSRTGNNMTVRTLDPVLGGSWDLVTIYNWEYNPIYTWGNPYTSTSRGVVCKVIISPITSSY